MTERIPLWLDLRPLRAAALAAVALVGAAGLVAVRDQDPMTALALGVCVAFMVDVVLRAELSIVFSLALVASVLSGHTNDLGIPFPPDRLIFAAGVARLAWETWRDNLRPERPAPRHPGYGTPHVLALVAAAYALVSFAWSIDWQSRSSTFELIDRFGIVPFIYFALAPVVFATERARKHLLVAMTLLGGYLGLTAIFEIVGPRSLVFPRYIANPDVGITFGRARGPFAEPGSNGLAMHAAIVCTLLLLSLYPHRLSRTVKLLCGGVLVVCIVGILLTLTRQVWLASVVSMSFAGLLTPRGRRLLVPAALIVAIVAGSAYLAVPGLRDNVITRAGDAFPVWDRRNLNSAAVRMFQERPLTGWGWNGFHVNRLRFFQQADTYPLTTPTVGVHNVFLANLADLGLIGTVLWAFALLAALGGALLRRAPPDLAPWRTALVAIAIAWIVVANLSPLNTALPNSLVWLWVGIVWRPLAQPRTAARPVDPPEPDTPPTRRLDLVGA